MKSVLQKQQQPNYKILRIIRTLETFGMCFTFKQLKKSMQFYFKYENVARIRAFVGKRMRQKEKGSESDAKEKTVVLVQLQQL